MKIRAKEPGSRQGAIKMWPCFSVKEAAGARCRTEEAGAQSALQHGRNLSRPVCFLFVFFL